MDFPGISVLIPTLNAQKHLRECLNSISSQNYPKDKIEIVIADGGSTDDTLAIAREYKAKIIANPLKTGEAGKAIALKDAKNELIALIDSDNILPVSNWLLKMVAPFSDQEIIGSEPWEYTYRKKDGFIDRYCALLGMNDPLCFFLGNYDRNCLLTGKWTGLNLKQKDEGPWIEVTLDGLKIPTIGANGTFFRKDVLLKSGLAKDYLFDIDIIASMAVKNPVKFAKIKVGIIHLFSDSDIKKYIKKQKRRVKDYLYYSKNNLRTYPWKNTNRIGLIKFIIYTLLIFPLILESLSGYIKKPDTAWFFHPVACILTLFIYVKQTLLSKFSAPQIKRVKWQQ